MLLKVVTLMTPLFSPMYGWCLILALERVMETPSFVL